MSIAPSAGPTRAEALATGHHGVASTVATSVAVATAAEPTVAIVAAAVRPVAGAGVTPRPTASPAVSWVWDSDDDAACVKALLTRHDLGAGQVVCHPRPGATWPVLVEDLLRALGKHPEALTRERRRKDCERLLEAWLRAEPVTHLIVLRAHRLDPPLLCRLAGLASNAGTALWLVWHHHDPPPNPYPSANWTEALAVLDAAATAPPGPSASTADDVFQAARAEARAWQPDGRRLGPWVPFWQHAWPGCDTGALLQRLTIDAATCDDVRTRLHAAQEGFAAEGRRLTLPGLDERTLAVLGPRITPQVATRLRTLVCPATAAAIMLGLATDAEARFLRYCTTSTSPEQVTLLAGTYRVPERAQVLMRAAALSHHAPGTAHSLLARPETGLLLSPQRLAHTVRRGAVLAGIDPPLAARPLYGINPATPFAAAVATRVAVTNASKMPLTMLHT